MAMVAIDKYKQGLEKALNEKNKFTDFLATAESHTGVKRLYLVIGGLAVISLWLMVGYGAGLVCNCISYIYPAYMSVKALESRDKEDDTKWLTYWVVFALFSVAEFFVDIFLSWFPIYWLAKCVFFIWCFIPVPWNGSIFIYNRIIRPFFLKHESQLDQAVNKAKDTLTGISDKAKDAAQSAVEDTFKKSF